jgi:hypothetical protein
MSPLRDQKGSDSIYKGGVDGTVCKRGYLMVSDLVQIEAFGLLICLYSQIAILKEVTVSAMTLVKVYRMTC